MEKDNFCVLQAGALLSAVNYSSMVDLPTAS